MNCFNTCLRGRDISVPLHLLGAKAPTNHTRRETKCLHDSLFRNVLTRVGPAVLNKLMRATERAENVGRERDEVMRRTAFSMCYFHHLRSADQID
jgi:hypothetical protein